MLNRALSGALLVLAVVTSGLVTMTITAAPAAAFADRDCGDFASQRAAQIFYINAGGPRRDPHDLDRDDDGIACDSNPCPCYFDTELPPITTEARLTLSQSQRIAGESVRMTVQVLPRKARSVVIQRQTDSGWVRAKAGRTNGRGVFTARLTTRAADTTYRALASATRIGGRRYTTDASPGRTLTTQDQSVTLTLSKTRAAKGQEVNGLVQASPVRTGRSMALHVLRNGIWKQLTSKKQNRQGRVSFDVPSGALGTFSYRAVAVRRDGAAARASQPQELEIPDKPVAPTGLVAAPQDGSADLTWNAVGGAVVGYRVYRATSSTGPWSLIDSTTDPAYAATGLANATTYWFAVRAIDDLGQPSAASAASSVTPADTTAPAAPTNLVAVAGDSVVDLTWTAVTGDVAGYRLYQLEADGSTWTPIKDLGLVTTYRVPDLSNGTEYTFRLTATDEVPNESTPSNTAADTPQAAGP